MRGQTVSRGGAPQGSFRLSRRKSSTISLFRLGGGVDAKLSFKLGMISAKGSHDNDNSTSSRKIKRTRRCPGCRQSTFVEDSSFCMQCEKKAMNLLTEAGGFQFGRGILEKARNPNIQGLPRPVGNIWLEQYDKKDRKTFFFNVATGQSEWRVPQSVNAATESALEEKREETEEMGAQNTTNTVLYFTADELKLAKRKRVPEWKAKPTGEAWRGSIPLSNNN